MAYQINIANREINPRVINFFQFENGVTTLEFTLDNYIYDEIDLRNYKAYAVTSIKGSVDMTELEMRYDDVDDKLILTWNVGDYTITQDGAIIYQITFKQNEDDGENSAVWYSYKAIMINRGSVDAEHKIVAEYPTIMKQWLDKMGDMEEDLLEVKDSAIEDINNMAANFDTSVVYIPYGETIPVEERLSNRLYYQYTDEAQTKGRFEDSEGVILNLDPTGYVAHVGQTIFSLLPITNGGLRLLDGSKIDGNGGYAGFVDHIAKLYNAKNNLKANVAKVGSLSDENGVLTGFSSANYATLPNAFSPEAKSWDIVISGTFVKNEEMQAFVTPQSKDTFGVYIGTDSEGCFFAELSSGDSEGDIEYVGSRSYLVEGQPYWIKVSFTGTQYVLSLSTDGITYNVEDSVDSTIPVYSGLHLALGIDYYRSKLEHAGEINLNECYINIDGKRWWTGAMPVCFADEATWQQSVTDYGVCGKFVYDVVENSVRLPKVTGFVEGTIDANALGELVRAGLPNITGKFESKGINSEFGTINYGEGAFEIEVGSGLDETGNAGTSNIVNTDVARFDASRSNAIYGNSDTVQPQAIKGYYYMVVATSVIDKVEIDSYIDEIEAKTEECIERIERVGDIELNNPFSLLDYKWSEYELNNASWLLSNGAFHSGTVYKSVYELLLKIKNGTETKNGVSVKLSTEAYTDTDFVINTADTTFRLPIKVKQKFYNAISGNYPVVGNGMTLGLTSGSQTGGMIARSHYGNNELFQTDVYGDPYGTIGNTSSKFTDDGKSIGVTTDASKSGLVAKLSSTEVSGLKLYFYVGETIQDANVVNASGVLTRVAELSDSYISGLGMPSNKYIDLTLGASGSTYTAPANGWVVFRRTSTGAGQNFQLVNSSRSAIQIWPQAGTSSGIIGGFIPVQKGDKFGLTYTLGSATNQIFRFIYAEGDK